MYKWKIMFTTYKRQSIKFIGNRLVNNIYIQVQQIASLAFFCSFCTLLLPCFLLSLSVGGCVRMCVRTPYTGEMSCEINKYCVKIKKAHVIYLSGNLFLSIICYAMQQKIVAKQFKRSAISKKKGSINRRSMRFEKYIYKNCKHKQVFSLWIELESKTHRTVKFVK